MRFVVVAVVALAAAAPSHAQRSNRNDTGPVERACSVADCFMERDIRHFEVIDRTHVIVYAGPQRCAFHVEVRGTFCDLTFAPELYFSRTNELPDNLVSRDSPRGSAFDPLEIARRERRDLRVCANDLGIQVHGGAFTESPSASLPNDRFGNPRTDCRVTGVTAITDDQLLEFYVERGVLAPPPPMGSGDLEVGEQPEPPAPPVAESTDGSPQE